MSAKLSPRSSEVKALEQRGYYIGKKVGQGSYAIVHAAEFCDGSDKRMRLACKIFDKERAPRDFLDKFFPRELEILTKIENPHIIQVHSILQRGPRVFIFMRFADNGDLLDFVKRNNEVPEPQCRLWFRQMTSGLHYLHSKNIAHRDLKCENILLSRRFNVKLADFGFARYCIDGEGRRVLSQTYCGSAAYAAPEVVNGTPYNPKLADVWSLGIILFIMLNASMPFDDSNLRKLLKDQTNRNWRFRTKVRDTVTSMAKAIVRHLLEPDVTQRLTLERVMALEWVRCRKEKAASSAAKLTQPAADSSLASSPSLPQKKMDSNRSSAVVAHQLLSTNTPNNNNSNNNSCSNNDNINNNNNKKNNNNKGFEIKSNEAESSSKHRKSAISKSTGATPNVETSVLT